MTAGILKLVFYTSIMTLYVFYGIMALLSFIAQFFPNEKFWFGSKFKALLYIISFGLLILLFPFIPIQYMILN